MEGKKSEHRQGKQMLLCRCSWLFYHLRDNEWWRRGESNPCPKILQYSFLRVHHVFWNSHRSTPTYRLWSPVAILCVIRPMAKNGCTFTANWRSVRSRDTLRRNGLSYDSGTAYAARATFSLAFNFKLDLLRDCPALPAYHMSKSPSKPLRPHVWGKR